MKFSLDFSLSVFSAFFFSGTYTAEQVGNEEEYLGELSAKLRRRRREAADGEEITRIEREQLQVRARLAAARSSKLAELKGEANCNPPPENQALIRQRSI